MKNILMTLFVSTFLMSGNALAFGLNDLLNQAGKIADQLPKNDPKQESPSPAPLPAVAPTPSKSDAQRAEEDERKKAEAKAKTRRDYDDFVKKQEEAKAESARKKAEWQAEQKRESLNKDEERTRRLEAEDQERLKADEEYRRETEEMRNRFENAKRKEEAEAQRQHQEYLKKSEIEGRARGVIPAPFGQHWGNENFGFLKKRKSDKANNVETFEYITDKRPNNTDTLSFLVCDMTGLQQIIWKSLKYDAWNFEQAHKKLQSILTQKYGTPTSDSGYVNVNWVGAFETGVILITNKYSNKNINFQIHYRGPNLQACIKKYNESSESGF